MLRREEFDHLFERLPTGDQKTVIDLMEYLVQRARTWDEIDALEPDDEPITVEEQEQLSDSSGYLPWEDVKRELGL
ncbi:MAG: hypothetical protein ACYCYO_09680 [Bacilli bacterium]